MRVKCWVHIFSGSFGSTVDQIENEPNEPAPVFCSLARVYLTSTYDLWFSQKEH